ncbi:hypothetical protein HIM_07553 [Hirsutella minnesotensis 3608]|uniref:Uncharacterized protein n=1 Tax=Hirsutella minnesotensis 3608 TaxID=1043627 RepID=A0A0F7ZHP1_9HYPO|nr:hypothetical protein HIM_07553 [Hirsutella minnesotensis 3608]
MFLKLTIPETPPPRAPSSDTQHRERARHVSWSVSCHSQRHTEGTKAIPLPDNILRPRPYEDIYTEQAYLTASIQLLSKRANHLLTKYILLEYELWGMEASKQRRRLRKQLSQTRLQLTEAVEQEKAMFLRLSEVYMEAHSRDTWSEANRQRTALQQMYGARPWDSRSNHVSSVPDASRPSTRLNGASPEFVPRISIGVNRQTEDFEEWSAGPSTTSSSPLDDSVRETETEDTGESVCSEQELSHQYKTPVGPHEDGASPTSPSRTSRDNRLSLPCLESIWPG